MKLLTVVILTLVSTSAQTSSVPKLLYATVVGPGPGSVPLTLAADSYGFAYVGGFGPGPDSTTSCAFLTKLNQAGTAAVWNICLPMDQVDAVRVDAAGFVYVAGQTGAKSVTAGRGTVMKLAPDSGAELFAVNYTGLGNGLTNLAVDASGSVYVAGPSTAVFQPTPGAYSSDPTNRSFALKLNPFSEFAFATFLDWTLSKASL